MLQWVLANPELEAYEHLVYDLSRGTYWEQVGRKGPDPARIWRRVRLAAGLAAHSVRVKPSMVHFHCGSGGRWDFLGDMLLLAAARRAAAPILFHWHRNTHTSRYPGTGRASQMIFRQSAGKAEALAVLLEEYRSPLEAIGLGPKLHVVPNTFDPMLLSLPLPRPRAKGVRIAYLGRLSAEKGFPDLLNAAGQLSSREEVTNIHFLVAGAADPELGGLNEVRTELNRRGVGDRVRLLGPVSLEEKAALLGRSDVFVLPSYRESFGIAALEAMAAGLPVVAYDVGSLRDIVGEGGTFVPVGDTMALGGALLDLAQDRERRERLGALGRARATAAFGPEKVGAVLRDIYTSLTESGRFRR